MSFWNCDICGGKDCFSQIDSEGGELYCRKCGLISWKGKVFTNPKKIMGIKTELFMKIAKMIHEKGIPELAIL